MKKLEVFAIPVYFATTGAEFLRHRDRVGRIAPLPGDSERRDTLTSLAHEHRQPDGATDGAIRLL